MSRFRIIALANQKGGVGKTTTAINLGTGLAAMGRRTLVVDLDPHPPSSFGLGQFLVRAPPLGEDRDAAAVEKLAGETDQIDKRLQGARHDRPGRERLDALDLHRVQGHVEAERCHHCPQEGDLAHIVLDEVNVGQTHNGKNHPREASPRSEVDDRATRIGYQPGKLGGIKEMTGP